MKDIFEGKQRERIKGAKKRTERYFQALSPEQKERLYRMYELSPRVGEKIPYEQKKELTILKNQMENKERKYLKSLYKEMALYT